ncbi:aromatic compound dioxygenase, partial [Periconia macrospinosa]
LFDYRTTDIPGEKQGACILTPESIYGPYWREGQPERQDIRAGQDGIYMRLAVQVIDIGTCIPLEGAQVDVWQANGVGHYSDHAGDWLRGRQRTGKWGTADFDTIFPGHYAGRTTHTHVAVRAKDNKHMMHVGQIYYDDWPRMMVENTEPYKQNESPPTANKDDGVFIEMAASKDYDPFAKWAWLGPNYPHDGIIAWIIMGVNTTATVEQPPPQER